jgi:peptide/nickel transport system permease protein
LSLGYLIRRVGAFLVTIFLAATLNFIIPRLTPQDPIAAMMDMMASRGSTVADSTQIMAQYRQQFGLDKPLLIQYVDYMKNLFLHADMGYSISYFPAKVTDVILGALPWTLGLLLIANLFAFIIGNLLGALAIWPKTSKPLRYAIYGLMPLSAIPYYLLALMLLYLLAFLVPLFPLGGGLTVGRSQSLNWETIVDIARHAALPALSIALSLIGFWALSMRGSMALVLGEDYLTYGRTRGLKDRHLFARYAMRNALLPQVTAFAIDLGKIVSGALLAEIIFSYPGVGLTLFNALRTADYFVIQGVVFFVILGVALATLIVDLIYPVLDPRIRY